jgi:serum/glucocorticoid-regulated kinase 2
MWYVYVFSWPKCSLLTELPKIDEDFKRKRPKDSVVEANAVSQSMQDQFAGWSYNQPVTGFGDAGDSIRYPSFPRTISE